MRQREPTGPVPVVNRFGNDMRNHRNTHCRQFPSPFSTGTGPAGTAKVALSSYSSRLIDI